MVNTSALNYSSIREQLSKEDFSNVNIDAETIERVHSLAHFCAPPLYLGEYIRFKGYSVNQNIQKSLQQLEAPLFHSNDRCFLAGHRAFKCNKLFNQVLTDSGLCYTFNHLSSDDVYNSNLLADDFPKIGHFSVPYSNFIDFNMNGTKEQSNLSYPYKIRYGGTGLEINMWLPETENHFDPMCDGLLEGLKVQIHSAEDVPRLSKFFYHIPFDHDVRINVRPNMMVTSENLIKTHHLEERKCISGNENHLALFKIYTQHNCHLETLANESYRLCGCLVFWMPRFNATKMCTFSNEFKCVAHVENSIHNTDLTNNCLPACNSTTYEADISTSKKASNPTESKGFKHIKVLVLFKYHQYYASSRTELYGKMDFIDFTAACGGILNLFMGISILSIIEIIYFATFRLVFRNLYKRNCKNKVAIVEHQVKDSEV